MTHNRRDRVYIRGVCATFVQALVAWQLEEHSELFSILCEEVEKRGLRLEAHQRGVQGTYICLTYDPSINAKAAAQDMAKELLACRVEGRLAFERGEPCERHVWSCASAANADAKAHTRAMNKAHVEGWKAAETVKKAGG